MWTDDWIGLPYAERGRGPEAFDCLGLWLALQRARFGREIPDPACDMVGAVRLGVVDRYRTDFISVERAQEGDALLFTMQGRPLHLGYALSDQDMLHTLDDQEHCSRIERWRGPSWGGRLEGIYRIAG
ncbi:NlpC/P60 family protein [Ponticoccus sp. (in: a-proteobacteria)]|uniref:NlpC/P60 family protein n=1 Tax=Ponticoccus sp. (in: a-proteobacteria) TaxID=1925025 RepID=UPI003AB25589